LAEAGVSVGKGGGDEVGAGVSVGWGVAVGNRVGAVVGAGVVVGAAVGDGVAVGNEVAVGIGVSVGSGMLVMGSGDGGTAVGATAAVPTGTGVAGTPEQAVNKRKLSEITRAENCFIRQPPKSLAADISKG